MKCINVFSFLDIFFHIIRRYNIITCFVDTIFILFFLIVILNIKTLSLINWINILTVGLHILDIDANIDILLSKLL